MNTWRVRSPHATRLPSYSACSSVWHSAAALPRLTAAVSPRLLLSLLSEVAAVVPLLRPAVLPACKSI